MRIILTKDQWRDVYRRVGLSAEFAGECALIKAACTASDSGMIPVEFGDEEAVLRMGQAAEQPWIVRCAEAVILTR